MAQQELGFWDDADVISVYTRQQAIEDAVLIDVTPTAKEAGFTAPVAVTAAIWADIEAIPARLQGIQDVLGRLWDVVWMARCAARRGGSETIYYLILPVEGSRKQYYPVKMTAGPGDDGELVITLLKPEED